MKYQKIITSLCVTKLVFVFFASTTLYSQNTKKGDLEELSVIPHQLEARLDSLYLHLSIKVGDYKINNRTQIIFIPILSDGWHNLKFSPVVISGKIAAIENNRKMKFSSTHRQLSQHTIYSSKHELIGESIDYQKSTFFEPWMKNAHLDIKIIVDSGNKHKAISQRISDNVVVIKEEDPYKFTPALQFIHKVGIDTLEKVFTLQFTPKGKGLDIIDSSKTALVAEWEQFLQQPKLNIESCRIDGFTSPKRGLDYSLKLSFLRGEIMGEIIESSSNLPADFSYEIFGRGANKKLYDSIANNFVVEPSSLSVEESRKIVFPTMNVAFCVVKYQVQSQDENIVKFNKLLVELASGNILKSERLLEQISLPEEYSAEYHNAIGVLYLLKGEFEKGEEHLNMAIDSGYSPAKKNIVAIPDLKLQDEEY